MRYALISLLLMLSACGAERGGAPRARFGQDVCARCGMIVSEPRFAAGYVDEKGENVLFDDAGEALDVLREVPALKDRLYVNDLEEPGWLPAPAAYYVRAEGFATPMGSGVAAFRTRERAAAFARARQAPAPVDLEAALKLFQ